MTELYQRLRANGDIIVALSLAVCLVVPDWTIAVLSAYLFLLFVSSSFLSIWHSIRNYNIKLFKTRTGIYYNVKIAWLIPYFFLLFYHGDGLGGIETPLKSLLVAYIVVMNVDRFRWPVVLCGAAVGAITALLSGSLETAVYLSDRSDGATNSIRFGMIAMALAAFCAVGFLFARKDRVTASLAFAGFLAGIGAAVMSGSRGALLALPFVLALIAPALWRRSRRAFVGGVLLLTVFTGALLFANAGNMTARIETAYSNVILLVDGGNIKDSVGDRAKLLVLAFELFREHPLTGVGAAGWNEAADRLHNAPDPASRIRIAYNQAHNQYADDLAKGGIIRFLMNFALLFLPIYLFFKCEPYSGRQGSEFALAGLAVSTAFMIFCLFESLMILSLPAIIHSTIVFTALRGCDGIRHEITPLVRQGGAKQAATAA